MKTPAAFAREAKKRLTTTIREGRE